MARPAFEPRDVYFAFDSSELSPTAKDMLKDDLSALGVDEPNSESTVILEGRADERGTAAHNKRLSARRAKEVATYLKSMGIKPERIRMTSLGEASPMASGTGPTTWAKDRSVRVLVK